MSKTRNILLGLLTLSLLCFINSQVTLLVYGDIGEFEEFKDAAGSTDSDASVFKLDETALTCTKLTGTWKGYLQFQTLVNNDINGNNKFSCNADQSVILGDLIYPEVKGTTQKAIKIFRTEARYAGWRARVICATIVLKNVLTSINCPVNTKNPFGAKDSSGKLTKLDLILGNHSYDVDYELEAQYSLNLVNYNAYAFTTDTPPADINAAQKQVTWQEMGSVPVMDVQLIGDTRVEFLDINIVPLYCYLYNNPTQSETVFNSCFLLTQYGVFYTFAQAQLYTNRLIIALNSFSPTANWRVIRAHHPIMNIDGYPADNSWFWTISIDTAGNTLMDLIKKNNVNLILASHHHSSQILAYPWSQLSATKTAYSTLKASQTIGFSTEAFDLGNKLCGTICPDTATKCYYNDMFMNGSLETAVCDETARTMYFKQNTSAPGHLITFVQGGSGRVLDPLQSDQKVPEALLFARAVNHGGLNIKFNAKSLVAEFFENDKVYLTFNINNITPDTYPVIDNYVSQKLAGTLKATVGTVESILPFDFKKYVDATSASFLKYGLLMITLIFFLF